MQSFFRSRVPLWLFGLSLVLNVALGAKIFFDLRESFPFSGPGPSSRPGAWEQQGPGNAPRGRPRPFPIPLPGAPTQAQADVPTKIDPNPMPQPRDFRNLPLEPDLSASTTQALQNEIEKEIAQIAANRKLPIQGLKLILANKRCIVETSAIGRHATTNERESLRYEIRMWLNEWKMRHSEIKDRPISVRFQDDPAYKFQ